jgi:hypothetical protein
LEYSRLIQDLIDGAGDMPGRGTYEPGPGLPVCSTTSIPDVTESDYDAFERVVGIERSLPKGWDLRLALVNEQRITSFAVWRTLEFGRDFFAKVVAARLPDLVAMGVPLRDFVRHEYRLGALRLGARAGELVEGGPGPPAGAHGYVVTASVAIDAEQGRTMASAFERFEQVAGSPEVTAEFACDLMLIVGGVTESGMITGWLHADPDAGARLVHETVPRLANEAFAGWPSPAIEVEDYRAYRCTLKSELLATE